MESSSDEDDYCGFKEDTVENNILREKEVDKTRK